ncbi:unnamed protein product, partial [Closterium sp. NIES-54]
AVAAFGSGVAFSVVSGVGGPAGNSVLNALSTGVGFAIFQGAFFQPSSPKPSSSQAATFPTCLPHPHMPPSFTHRAGQIVFRREHDNKLLCTYPTSPPFSLPFSPIRVQLGNAVSRRGRRSAIRVPGVESHAAGAGTGLGAVLLPSFPPTTHPRPPPPSTQLGKAFQGEGDAVPSEYVESKAMLQELGLALVRCRATSLPLPIHPSLPSLQLGKAFQGEGDAAPSEYLESKAMLQELGLGKYEKNFKKGLLTDRTLPLLNDSALQEVKIPPGPRLIILNHIQRAQRCYGQSPSSAKPSSSSGAIGIGHLGGHLGDSSSSSGGESGAMVASF